MACEILSRQSCAPGLFVAVLHRRERREAAWAWRFRKKYRGVAIAQPRRLRARRSCARPRLQSGRASIAAAAAATRGGIPRAARKEFRHQLQPSPDDHQHAEILSELLAVF